MNYIKLKSSLKIVVLLILLSVPLQAQNSIYLVFQPCDMGLGLRYDREWDGIGGYVSYAQGNYKLGDNYIKDHKRATAGVVFRNFTAGIVYNKYGESEGTYPDSLFDPVSFEIGGKTYINRFTAGMRFDPIKCEGTWDFGIKF